MKIIDCFLYNSEDLILNLRLNLLNKYIDKFIIIEARHHHSGGRKEKYNFNIDNFSKFRNKIEYFQIDNFPNNLSHWERENFHRNYILKGLSNVYKDDYIIISDIDEIKSDWFVDAKTVGICGATSTPRWLMESVQKFVENLA